MRFPLGVNLESRDGTVNKDARAVNGIVEIKGEDARVRKRPGLADLGSVKSGTAQLLYAWNGLNTIQGDYLNRGTISTIVSSPTQTNLSPTTAGLQWTAADTGSNAATPRLMIKNRTQAKVVSQAGAVTDVTYGGTMGLTTSTLLSLTRSGTTATGTMSDVPTFNVGDSVTIAGANESSYNGAQTVTGITPGNPASTTSISSLTRSGTTATAVCVSSHGLTNGQSYAVSGATESGYNGSFTMSVVDDITFTYTVSLTGGGTAYGSSVTLNPSDKSTDVTLSGGNLTATRSGVGGGSVRATSGKSSGAWYWEITLGAIQLGKGVVLGIANASMPLADPPGQDSNSWGYNPLAGVILHSGANVQSGLPVSANGDIIGIHLDMDAGSVTFYKNGVKLGSTVTGVSGTMFPALYVAISAGGSISATANFGATSFSYDDDAPPLTATGSPEVTISAISSTFTFTVGGSPTTPATGTITVSTNGGTVPGIPYIDGYFCVMDVNGVIWNSAIDDPTSWAALSFITAQAVNGGGVALNRSLNYLIAFKEWSTEYFYDTKSGTIGSPFAPVDNGFIQIGCAAGSSVASVDGNLLWLAQTKEEGRSVQLMTGLQVQQVSTPDIERILNRDDLATVYAYGLKIAGHSLYLLTLVTSNITLVYDLKSQVWSQWSSLTLGNSVSVSSITTSGSTATVTTSSAHGLNDGDPVKISGADQSAYNGVFPATYVSPLVFTIPVAGSPTSPATGTIVMYPYSESYFKFTKYADYLGLNLFLHESDGHLYQMLPTLYQDAGIPINESMRSVRLDGGSLEYKKAGVVALVGDTVTNDGVNNFAMIRWSDDDYTTNNAYQPVDLSSDRPAILSGAGIFRRRSFEVKYLGNAAPVLSSIELTVG